MLIWMSGMDREHGWTMNSSCLLLLQYKYSTAYSNANLELGKLIFNFLLYSPNSIIKGNCVACEFESPVTFM